MCGGGTVINAPVKPHFLCGHVGQSSYNIPASSYSRIVIFSPNLQTVGRYMGGVECRALRKSICFHNIFNHRKNNCFVIRTTESCNDTSKDSD